MLLYREAGHNRNASHDDHDNDPPQIASIIIMIELFFLLFLNIRYMYMWHCLFITKLTHLTLSLYCIVSHYYMYGVRAHWQGI
jgi:hypothetical protein